MIDETIIETIARNEIGKVTIQLWKFPYEFNNKRRETLNTPKSYGTGVLLKRGDFRFLITAKHVCDGIDGNNLLYFQNSNDSFLSISGDVLLLDDDQDKRIDLAVIKLSDRTVREIDMIQNKWFLSENKLKPGIQFSGGELLLAVGFPQLSTKVDKKSMSITSVGNIWVSKAAISLHYDEYSMDKDFVIGFDYHGKATSLVTHEKLKKIDPEGISGGGLVGN
ncbi:hypothetical protein QWY85_12545 [Neolewinella lacunae]|uniref:Serine protease n=1 Tax=Neolewinella lacunae TaxID=1517758 RepID=A0A923PR34_9BACT|nr:hypothetical protein [Neolewinella lacunae]MBC6995197.1 hypothetical protein [Neolewinella lacunae]MDN3635494.1 hypothetical protein [Neolewinella lacunae]